jgi:small subunit ribosomal protein S2
MESAVQEQSDKSPSNPLLERLFSVGAHLGYSRSRRHPSVSSYIFGVKNRVEIFDLEKTADLLREASSFVEDLGSKGGKILFVGGKNEARGLIRTVGLELGMPYVAGRWIGGTLTNFSEIKKRIDRLEELIDKRDKGELSSRYTKREQVLFDREIADLKEHFEGLIPLSELPQALFVVDPRHEQTAVREAKGKNIPVIALLNSDCDAGLIEYPMVGNDASFKSIEFFVDEMRQAYRRGEMKRAEVKTAAASS